MSTRVLRLTILLWAAAVLTSADEIVYDTTQYYSGSETQTFDLYQPPAGQQITSVIVELLRPAPGSLWLDNENDYPVEVSIPPRPSIGITVSSTNVTFVPIIIDEPGLGRIFTLPAHDDPDGIDTIDAFQVDSGSDWYQSSSLGPLPVTRTILEPTEIESFLGIGTFHIELNMIIGPGGVFEPIPGVSQSGTIGMVGAWVRVAMTAVPEPEVSITGIAANNGTLVLQFDANRTGLLYVIESCTNLPAAAWEAVTPTSQWWISESIWTNTGPAMAKEFFRVRAKEQ